MRFHFTKMSGAGNDFVVIDNRSGEIRDGSRLARQLCDRRWGVGADGLLLLEKSRLADYRMMYFNADGSYGGMCGNGGRCIADFARSRGIASAKHKFEALDFVYRADTSSKGVVELAMKDPKEIQTDIVLPIAGQRLRMHYVDTGSPHVVLFLRKSESLDKVAVEKLGRLIRRHRRFHPEGTNVNFVKVTGPKSLSVRTYERGVESETLACGTGSIAASVLSFVVGGMKPPIDVMPRSGVSLSVDFDMVGNVAKVRLKGPVRVTYEGTIEVPDAVI